MDRGRGGGVAAPFEGDPGELGNGFSPTFVAERGVDGGGSGSVGGGGHGCEGLRGGGEGKARNESQLVTESGNRAFAFRERERGGSGIIRGLMRNEAYLCYVAHL